MRISHLAHSDIGIRCTGCGQQFEVSRRALTQPYQLLEWKEGIAAQHTCRPEVRRKPIVKEWRSPTGEIELQAYFGREMRRLLPA